MLKKYILSIDQGTTSSRAIIFDKQANIIAEHNKKHKQIYENKSWVSHDMEEIYQNVLDCCKISLEKAKLTTENIEAIAITNQRETIATWDKITGLPLSLAIVWQCKRTSDLCNKIKQDGFDKIIREKTGLIVDPYFSATKIKWLLENDEDVKKAYNENRLLVGTTESYLIWHLTAGKKHITDYTNASRTMLFNINTLSWDKDILDYFNINEAILPKIVSNSEVVALTDKNIFSKEIPISGLAGDQQASLFGHNCFEKGDIKNTYGTGCFILTNIGNKPFISKGKLLTTIAWNIKGVTTYALEGSIFNAGSAIDWLINELKIVKDVEEINKICAETKDTNGVIFVPAFSGLAAPYWDMNARAAILGMNLSTTNKEIAKAVMESLAYQTKDVLDYIEQEIGLKFSKLKVDGGASKSEFIMQFQADIKNIIVEKSEITETTALGAGFLAGLAVGYWNNIEDIKSRVKIKKIYTPNMPIKIADEKYKLWLKATSRVRNWVE